MLLLPRSTTDGSARWLSVESAGAYIDKTYEGMRHTPHAHQKELPIVMIGGKPRIDIKDIDRLCTQGVISPAFADEDVGLT